MSLSDPRRAVFVDMAYEIGGKGLAGFSHLLIAARNGDWVTAAAELKRSLLYEQVPKREDENIAILTSGQFPAGVTSAAGLIMRHEGCVLTAKPDAKGKWEIGYGHDVDAPAPGEPAPTCTPDQAVELLSHDYGLALQRAIDDIGPEYW